MARTKSMLSSIFFSCNSAVQFTAPGTNTHAACAATRMGSRTVMIGSRGPKISSVMMAESSGGFSRIVGSMYLSQFRQLMHTEKRNS